MPGCPHPNQAGRESQGAKSEDEAETAGTSWEERVRTEGPQELEQRMAPFTGNRGEKAVLLERVKWDLHPHRGPPWGPRVVNRDENNEATLGKP